jgi:signal transduction histidine kinase
VLTAAAALVRRRYPLLLLAGAVVHGLESGDASAALPFGAYAFVRYGPTGRLRWVVLGLAAAVALQPWQFTSGTEALNNVLVVIALLVLPAVLGLWVRTRAELLTALRERAERAEGEQQLRAREAVLAERARITREMHDMVGHRVSLMVLQAARSTWPPTTPTGSAGSPTSSRTPVAAPLRSCASCSACCRRIRTRTRRWPRSPA